MIELYDQEQIAQMRQSSKGNQLKWKRNDTWYKADYTGYEGLVEYMVSELLRFSTLDREEYVSYQTEQIRYGGRKWLGCASADFLQPGQQLITLERLYKNYSGAGLYQTLYKLGSAEERLQFLIKQMQSLTGLADFGSYMSKIITVDALFLNEDRHMHNIAVILADDGTYRTCPLFDHGAGLLSDTLIDYPLEETDLYAIIDRVQAKGISVDFDEQLEAVETRFGEQIRFNFTHKDVHALLEKEPYYSKQIKDRVERIILDRMRKYPYLFSDR